MEKYKSIDLFAGIGGIRLGFDRAFGKDIETVFVSEWDIPAQKTYRANFDDKFEIAGDITQVNEKEIPSFDICLAGFPCQAFSMAGKHGGFNDNYKGRCRGTLFQDVVRICDEHKPKVIFCENVKGLTIHDHGNTFKVIKGAFEELGYKVFTQILNSKNFGVPQNRERIYLVCFRNDIAPVSFKFPEGSEPTTCIRDIMDPAPVPPKYYLSDTYVETLRRHRARHEAAGNGFGYVIRPLEGIAGTIVCGGMGREGNLIIDNRPHSMEPTTHIQGRINGEGIRKMTPREWARLQGFPEDFKLPLSDVHLYKQFGNSVTVNVIEAIAKEIKKTLAGMAKNKVWEFNKGEWSEAYVFLKLLADGRIYAADESAHRNLSTYIDIIDILRFEKKKEFRYERKNNDGEVIIEAYRENDKFYVVTAPELEDKAAYLFRSIRDARPGRKKKTFTITELQSFLEDLGFSSPKVPSIPKDKQDEYGKKADIIITLKDSIDGQVTKEGFSIKSRLGSNPTLFNAAPASGLIYEVEGCTEELMHRINLLGDFSRKMIPAMKEHGLNLSFIGTYPKNGVETFRDNVVLVESTMPAILGRIMLYQCGFLGRTGSMSSELTEAIAQENPFRMPHPENYYMTKLKAFHFATFAGMTASEEWDGRNRLSGGFIDVNREGELLYYRAISNDVFSSYLFDHLYFDRPDRGYRQDIAVAKARAYFEGRELTADELFALEYDMENGRPVKKNLKCDWGYIYEKDGRYYISINFQTRFR